MKKKTNLILLSVLTVVIFIFLSATVSSATPNLQTTTSPTPTPGPDGRILYQVQAGDTLWDIAAKFGFDADGLDDLRLLNNMEDGDVVIAGEFLIIGIQEQIDVDEEIDVSLTPEPTLTAGTGAICILLYEDQNGDSFRQELESSIVDGAVSVTEKTGLHSESRTTVEGLEPVCFEEIPEGDYNISVALPENYNATTFMTASLILYAGDTAYINFGGQFTGKEIEVDTETSSTASLLYGVGGILLVLGGAGLGAYTILRGRKVDVPKM